MKFKSNLWRLSPCIAFFYRWWTRSIRFEVEGFDNFSLAAKGGKPIIMCSWHNELFPIIGLGMLKKQPLVCLASESKDGQIITEVLERIGFDVIRGSSTRGGLKALVGMSRSIKKDGKIGAITIDGPKGPRHEIKPGILSIAQKTGAIIIPVRAYPSNPFIFHKSWDKFELPKPFMKCKVFIGNPFKVTESKLSETVLKSELVRLKFEMDMLGT